MDLSDGERQFLGGMRAIRIEQDGAEVYVGLTRDESEEFLTLSREDEAPGKMEGPHRDRFLALRKKHEAERGEIVEGRKSLYPKSGG